MLRHLHTVRTGLLVATRLDSSLRPRYTAMLDHGTAE